MYNQEERKIERACNIAIRNIIKEGTTDVSIFNRPFELHIIEESQIRGELVKDVVEKISQYNLKDLKVKKIGHVLFPKKNFADYRKCALIDIEDEIKFLTIVLLMADTIEQNRINKSEERVFSYRLLTNRNNDYLFDPNYTYTSFANRVLEKSKMNKNKVIVECDISNFYDRLNLHRLESTLAGMQIDSKLVNLLNELLLFWANRDSYGLPVGSNASRILAEAELSRIDNFLVDRKIDFCRFVDDYRIFCKNSIEAHHYLTLLIETLSKDGLFLNCSKTKIKEIDKNKILEKTEKIKKEGKQESLKAENFSKVVSGYSGLIPVKFRKLTDRDKEKLKIQDELEKIEELKDNLLIDPEEFRKTINIIIAKENYDKLSDISEIIKKFPQFTPLYYDVIMKYESEFSIEAIDKIKYNLQNWIENEKLPEYILIYIVRILALERFLDKSTIMNIYRKLNKNSGDYIGRAILECLEGKLDRNDIIEIKSYYEKSDIWEKREIIKIVKSGLYGKEASPFLKDIKTTLGDSIIQKYNLLR